MSNVLTLSERPAAAPATSGTVTFVGNATVLIRYAGFTLLTDPTFVHMHEKVSIGYGLHATRLTDPALDIADLPPLDFILLSHFHGDHFDQVAERDLDHALPVITTPHAARELAQRGFHATHALATWASITVTKGDARLRITSMPGRHGPPLSELLLPELMGSMLEFQAAEGARPFRLYITAARTPAQRNRRCPARHSAARSAARRRAVTYPHGPAARRQARAGDRQHGGHRLRHCGCAGARRCARRRQRPHRGRGDGSAGAPA
jgi:hypothetical protein